MTYPTLLASLEESLPFEILRTQTCWTKRQTFELILYRLHWYSNFRSKMPSIRILTDSQLFLVAESESEVRFWLCGLNFALLPVLRF